MSTPPNDNAVHQLHKNRTLEFKEIENLYLLTALGELGKEYWLDQNVLREHLGIKQDVAGNYVRDDNLSYFALSTSLLYMKHKKKYDKLRVFIEAQIVSKISAKEKYKFRDAETLMMFLDTMVCPYVASGTKDALATIYGLDAPSVHKLEAVSRNWFTSWGQFRSGRGARREAQS